MQPLRTRREVRQSGRNLFFSINSEQKEMFQRYRILNKMNCNIL